MKSGAKPAVRNFSEGDFVVMLDGCVFTPEQTEAAIRELYESARVKLCVENS